MPRPKGSEATRPPGSANKVPGYSGCSAASIGHLHPQSTPLMTCTNAMAQVQALALRQVHGVPHLCPLLLFLLGYVCRAGASCNSPNWAPGEPHHVWAANKQSKRHKQDEHGNVAQPSFPVKATALLPGDPGHFTGLCSNIFKSRPQQGRLLNLIHKP